MDNRKFFVWFVSLGAVLVVYLLYNHLSKTPKIDVEKTAEFGATASDSNVEQVGKIGDVGVSTIEVAKYTHLNKEKQVDREFGFEKLLHETGNVWEIEKPFMNVFGRDFKCFITSDRGEVQVETAIGKASPKDATLSGNVVIHIRPEKGSSIQESFIYLDDIVFNSETSQFSTAGPVRFVSQDALLVGKGLELVYNGDVDRLELLRVIHLESLKLRIASKKSVFSPSQTDTESAAKPDTGDATKETAAEPAESTQTTEQKRGEYYKCIFSKNVVVNCPEQLAFADEISISNILHSKSARAEPNDKGYVGDVNSAVATEEPIAEVGKVEESDKDFSNIIVTCDNGIFVVPMDSSKQVKDFFGTEAAAAARGDKNAEDFNDVMKRTTLTAKKIDYCMTTNKVVMEGDCSGSTVREDPNGWRKYTLSAPQIAADLAKDKTKRASAVVPGLKHLTASGGVVRLSTIKTRKGKAPLAKKAQGKGAENLLGGVELKCLKFDYDSGQRMCLAVGPGTVVIDNSKVTEPEKKAGKLSLRKKCYVVVRDFETLKYSMETNHVIADTSRGGLLIDYFPIVRGEYGPQVAVSASHVEADLVEIADGRTELTKLTASGGVTYEEKDIQFVGSEMFYDAGDSVIKVKGSEFQPCLLNGSLVDGIRYDLKTGKFKGEVVSPGLLQMK